MKLYEGTPSQDPNSIYIANSLRFEKKYVALDSISGQHALKLITSNDKAIQIDSLKSNEFLAARFIIWEAEAFTDKVYTFNCCHLSIPPSMPSTWACKTDYNAEFSDYISKVPLRMSLYMALLSVSKTSFTTEQRDNFLAGKNLTYPSVVNIATNDKPLLANGAKSWENESFSIKASYTTSDQPVTLTISDSNPQVTFVDIRGVLL